MSIYRKHHRGPYGVPAVDPLKPRESGESARESLRTTPLHDEPEARLRRQAPIDVPLAPTFKWIAKLPLSVQPLNLLRRYPRLANSMAAAWNDPKSLRAHIDDLLIDRRGGRQGLPAEILGELLALGAYYENLHPEVLDVYKETGKRT
ncbi:MAG: hypothetical protein H0T80_08470 [Betaproteobacteria bacterium]|nr:hypothetical protein [Betaproteobacteria bacterium]